MLMTSTSPSQEVQVLRFRLELHIRVSMATAELSSITEYSVLATTTVVIVQRTALEEMTIEGTTDVGAVDRRFV